LGGGGGC